ncbi:hypothetical protein A2U01_0073774, partial [Trifolium medium]|nr:hypothetical protein [Trifolium medium]
MSGASQYTPPQCGHWLSAGWPSNNQPLGIQRSHQSYP